MRVERDGDVTRIIVAMPGLYVPVPRWLEGADLLYLFVAPIWWLTSLSIRTLFRIPPPPRAVFEIDATQMKVLFREKSTGEVAQFEWPRTAVVEARANRYSAGLWLNVPGHTKETYLPDLSPELISRIEIALQESLNLTAARSTA